MLRTLLLLGLLLLGCNAADSQPSVAPSDPEATAETRALFHNLYRLAPRAILYGHQDDLAYGVSWWAEPGRSDVKAVTGSYPAVYGWDVGDLEHGAERNLDGVRFDDMRRWIIEGFQRGGIITISWHMDNPVSGGNAWDTTRAVDAILPGGPQHALFRSWLDRFADFVRTLRGVPPGRTDTVAIPIIFRPYHEWTGSWFWWGRGHCTPDEFIQLWRFTVDYLRREKGLHNLLLAYSSDRFHSPEDYLERYPGDDYVDLLGFDDYHSHKSEETLPFLIRELHDVVRMARARGKLAALTETGYEAIPDSTWWTGKLLRALDHDDTTRQIIYVLTWRNAYNRPGHYFAPYPGHPSAEDFRRFKAHPLIYFEDELPDLYRLENGR